MVVAVEEEDEEDLVEGHKTDMMIGQDLAQGFQVGMEASPRALQRMKVLCIRHGGQAEAKRTDDCCFPRKESDFRLTTSYSHVQNLFKRKFYAYTS